MAGFRFLLRRAVPYTLTKPWGSPTRDLALTPDRFVTLTLPLLPVPLTLPPARALRAGD